MRMNKKTTQGNGLKTSLKQFVAGMYTYVHAHTYVLSTFILEWHLVVGTVKFSN